MKHVGNALLVFTKNDLYRFVIMLGCETHEMIAFQKETIDRFRGRMSQRTEVFVKSPDIWDASFLEFSDVFGL